jgi:hypothetical protein
MKIINIELKSYHQDGRVTRKQGECIVEELDIDSVIEDEVNPLVSEEISDWGEEEIKEIYVEIYEIQDPEEVAEGYWEGRTKTIKELIYKN